MFLKDLPQLQDPALVSK